MTVVNNAKTAVQYLCAATNKISLEVNRAPVRQNRYGEIYMQNTLSQGYVNPTVQAIEDVLYYDFITDKAGEVVDDLGSVLPTEPTRQSGGLIQVVFNNATANLRLGIVEYRINETDALLARLKRREINPAAAA